MRPTLHAPQFGRRGVRTERYKLMVNVDKGSPLKVELYDRKSDPYELDNIAESSKEVVLKLAEEELVPLLSQAADPWEGMDALRDFCR